MLVLTRKQGQRIIIAPGIEIVVTQVQGDKVRLGITAPEGVAIHREEVYQRILAEQQQAAVETCTDATCCPELV